MFYIVGTTNVGKSTLINKLIEQSVGEKDVVTTSRFPGTTLDLIDIPLDEKRLCMILLVLFNLIK